MNLRLNFILLVIVAILVGWYYSQQPSEKNSLENLIKKEHEADYTGNTMATMVYDITGKPQYFAQAQEIKRYEMTEKTEFFKPFLDLFDSESALKQWKVSADYAELTKNKQLNLQGNVKIESQDPQSRLQKIESEQLSVDLNTQDIASESIVKSWGNGFVTTGRGLTGNLKKQTATLLHDVKSSIEPTVIQAPKGDKN